MDISDLITIGVAVWAVFGGWLAWLTLHVFAKERYGNQLIERFHKIEAFVWGDKDSMSESFVAKMNHIEREVTRSVAVSLNNRKLLEALMRHTGSADLIEEGQRIVESEEHEEL